jgi:hypothetical protein
MLTDVILKRSSLPLRQSRSRIAVATLRAACSVNLSHREPE